MPWLKARDGVLSVVALVLLVISVLQQQRQVMQLSTGVMLRCNRSWPQLRHLRMPRIVVLKGSSDTSGNAPQQQTTTSKGGGK